MNSANHMIKSLMCHNLTSHPLMVIREKQITLNEHDNEIGSIAFFECNGAIDCNHL